MTASASDSAFTVDVVSLINVNYYFYLFFKFIYIYYYYYYRHFITNARAHCLLQCSDTVGWATGRAIRPVKSWYVVVTI